MTSSLISGILRTCQRPEVDCKNRAGSSIRLEDDVLVTSEVCMRSLIDADGLKIWTRHRLDRGKGD
jgi:hypothetical protein